ncbi:unnamed protein product [Linum trigynum]|uniref:ARID domain-containing protein n=1 Tax=Linum trigynum TaxID=586398 RepID=A0AAV2DIZ5_9ROSI
MASSAAVSSENKQQAPPSHVDDDDYTWVWVDEKEAAAEDYLPADHKSPKNINDDNKKSVSQSTNSSSTVCGLVSLSELYHDGGSGYESGTEEERAEFMEDLKSFYRGTNIFPLLDTSRPAADQHLNLLKLWRAVTRLGGYQQVTSSQMWRQVGQSLRLPRGVSWSTVRSLYEKALVGYEKHKLPNTTSADQLLLPNGPLAAPENQHTDDRMGWQSDSFMD